jgi:proteasome alpha subunit
MPYSPYDWNESIQQRNEYIEDRLKEGSPVIAFTYDAGLLMLSLRQTQRKVYEIYDRLMMSAIGNHSDIEQIRMATIDAAHTEGFQRSADDVTVNRLVSFRVSPAIKRIYSDPFAQPVVYRGIFAELGKTPDRDTLVILSYDGEFSNEQGLAVVAGSAYAEDRMRQHLKTETESGPPSLGVALRAAVYAWGVGKKHLDSDDRSDADYSGDDEKAKDVSVFITDSLDRGWIVEAGVLERSVTRENRFRLLSEAELAETVAAYK